MGNATLRGGGCRPLPTDTFNNNLNKISCFLVISFEEAKCTYSTKPAGCALDHWMHSLTCKAENFKVLLASSPKYTVGVIAAF